MIAGPHVGRYGGGTLRRKCRNRRKAREKEKAADNREIRASCEKVGGFVARLRDFHGSLNEAKLAMLGTRSCSRCGAYGYLRRYGDSEEAWNYLIGRIEEQDDEDT